MSIALLSILLLGQTPAPQASPSTKPVVVPAPPQTAGQRLGARTAHLPAVGESIQATIPADLEPPVRPRVDEKKPYMRVWYWPPMPVSEEQSDGHSHPSTPLKAMLDPVYFPTNRSKVVDAKEALTHLAAWLKAHPTAHVTLDGYADTRGKKAKNQKLSNERAESVKDYLVKDGCPASQITVAAHGSTDPVKGETKEETYWLSRRVSIRFSLPKAVEKDTHNHDSKE